MKYSDQPKSFDLSNSHIVRLTNPQIEEKIRLIQSGLTVADVQKVALEIEVDIALLYEILAIESPKKPMVLNQRLSFNSSDRLMALADLYAIGYAITKNPPVFKSWMKRKFRCGQQDIPIEVCSMVTAMRELERLLVRSMVARIEGEVLPKGKQGGQQN